MKKITSILPCLLSYLISSNLYSQNQGVVVYENRQDKLKILEVHTLKFQQDKCLFSKHLFEKKFTTPEGYNVTETHDYFDWYFEPKTKKCTEQVRLKNGTIIWAGYEHEAISWKIENETKVILGHKVQKATALKHPNEDKYPREYGMATAWFATDIPIPFGPYKYVGLPGLILELEFALAGEYFIAKEIKFEPTAIEIPNQGTQVTYEQLKNPSKIDKKLLKKANDLLNNEN